MQSDHIAPLSLAAGRLSISLLLQRPREGADCTGFPACASGLLDSIASARLTRRSRDEFAQRQINDAVRSINQIASRATFGDLMRLARGASIAACLGVVVGSGSPAAAEPLNPLDFPSQGNVVIERGRLYFNTDTGTIDDPFQGQHLQATLQGPVAVMSFDSLTVASSVTLVLSGARTAALLSRSNLIMSGSIMATGFDGGGTNSTAAGWGASGRYSGGGGDGGTGATFLTNAGQGGGAGGGLPGAGYGSLGECGGGGFGGRGAGGAPYFGAAYGDLLSFVQAGSGGGGGRSGTGPYETTFAGAGGGAGGGGVELGALGSVMVLAPGMIAANGGQGGQCSVASSDGGGGSGGAVLLHGATVAVFGVGIDASGGFSRSGAHGGGGRVAVQATSITIEPYINIQAGGTGAQDGVVTLVHQAISIPNLDFGPTPLNTTKTLFMSAASTGEAGTSISGQFPIASAPFARVGDGLFSRVRSGQAAGCAYTFTPTSPGPFSQTLNVLTDGGVNVQVTITGIAGTGCASPDIDGDGDVGTDADIEAFFRVLAGGHC